MKEFITGALREAGQILLDQSVLPKVERYKSNDGSLIFKQIVTKQDLEAENFLISRILDSFPGVNIISEEKENNKFSTEVPTFVIDPIDGSMNYYRGVNLYSVSISYWEQNKPQYAGVYSPYNNEMFYAAKNQGSFLNDRPIKVSEVSLLKDALILLSGYSSFDEQKKTSEFGKIVASVKNMRMFSSSILDMCFIAAGRCDVRIYSNAKFWDLSAGSLILAEAGGTLTDWSGNPDCSFSPFIIASNGVLQQTIINLLD